MAKSPDCTPPPNPKSRHASMGTKDPKSTPHQTYSHQQDKSTLLTELKLRRNYFTQIIFLILELIIEKSFVANFFFLIT